jgi:hypothetical protein
MSSGGQGFRQAGIEILGTKTRLQVFLSVRRPKYHFRRGALLHGMSQRKKKTHGLWRPARTAQALEQGLDWANLAPSFTTFVPWVRDGSKDVDRWDEKDARLLA